MKFKKSKYFILIFVLGMISLPAFLIQNENFINDNSGSNKDDIIDDDTSVDENENSPLVNTILSSLSASEDLQGSAIEIDDISADIARIYGSSGKLAEIDIQAFRNVYNFPEKEKTSPIFFVNDMGEAKYPEIIEETEVLASDGYISTDEKIDVIAILGNHLGSEVYLLDNRAASAENGEFAKKIEALGGEITAVGTFLPYTAITLPQSYLTELADLEEIVYISIDYATEPHMMNAIPVVKDPTGWTAIEANVGQPVNGTGMTIAILDSGIDYNHHDLDDIDNNATTIDPKVLLSYDFTNDGTPMDLLGHGTHCASLAAGSGQWGVYSTGMASQAFLLNGKVLDHDGEGKESWLVQGIEWAVFNGADVISMSLGYGTYSEGFDITCVAVDWATAWPVTCVASAGNRGVGESIGYPGCARGVITVGAVDNNLEMADFSSRGATFDDRLKPDVVAPGVDILGATANGTCIGTFVNQYYCKADGTSMATPIVAGAVALLQQIHPSWTPKMIKAALVNTANQNIINPGYYGIRAYGGGCADLVKACNSSIISSEPSVSFGRVTAGTTPTIQIEIQNMIQVLTPPITVTLETSSVHWPSKVPNDNLITDVSSVNIMIGSSAFIQLSLNTILATDPVGHYHAELNLVTVDMNYSIPVYYTIIPPTDDNYEQNDLPRDAYDITWNYGRWLSQLNGNGRQNDHDFYRFYLYRGVYNVTFEMKGFSSNYLLLEVSNGSSSYTEAAWGFKNITRTLSIFLKGGRYQYIHISGDDEGDYYDFRIKSITYNPDDNYEQNDTPFDAVDITGHQGRWLHDLNGYGVANDEDWFQFYADTSQVNMTGHLRTIDRKEAVYFDLFDENYTLIEFWKSDVINFKCDLTYTGWYYIRVEDTWAHRGVKYDFRYFCGTPMDDNYEVNNYKVQAYNVSGNEGQWLSTIDGYGIGNDNDFYTFTTASAEPVIKFEFYARGIDGYHLEIYNSSNKLIFSDDDIDSDTTYYIDRNGETQFYIKVYANSLEMEYDFRFSFESGSGGYTPITAPFWFDGVGEYFWVMDSIPNHINSWEIALVEINGVVLSWQYKNYWELPPKIGGKYYIHYIGFYPWSHFEAY